MARDNEIGQCRCPLCGGTASVRVAASQLAYLAMDCCKAQLFARGDHADTLIRALLPKAAPAPAPAVEGTPTDPAPGQADPEPVAQAAALGGLLSSWFNKPAAAP